MEILNAPVEKNEYLMRAFEDLERLFKLNKNSQRYRLGFVVKLRSKKR